MAKKSSSAAILGSYVAWLGLMALAAVVGVQLNVLLLYLAGELIQNPALRPPGWSSASLVNIQRLTVLVLGSVWLIFILWMENDLRSALQAGRLGREIIRLGGVLGGIAAAIALLLRLAA